MQPVSQLCSVHHIFLDAEQKNPPYGFFLRLVGQRNILGPEAVAMSVLMTEVNLPKMTKNKLKIVLIRKESLVVAGYEFFHKGRGLGWSEKHNIGGRS